MPDPNERPMDLRWMTRGACRGRPASFFFPSDGVGVEIAQRVCATCSVRVECLEYALAERIDHGVWGGASERMRRRIIKARRTGAREPEVVLPFPGS